MESHEEVTQLLQQARDGDKDAERRLYEAVYEQLRRIAHRQMSGEQPGNTGQPTALVHEWYLAINFNGGLRKIESRRHLLNAAAKAMWRLLIDHARARQRKKRGGEMGRVPLDEIALAYDNRGLDLMALNEGLDSLRIRTPKRLEIFSLEFFCGLSPAEIAETIGTGVNNVYVQLREAKAYLRKFIPEATK